MEEGSKIAKSITEKLTPTEDLTIVKNNIYVFYSREKDIAKETHSWVEINRMFDRKNYKTSPTILPETSKKKNVFGKLDDNDILCIHCHGLETDDPKKQAVFMTEGEGLSPKKFSEYLKDKGLPQDKIIDLHILACYSDGFAKNLHEALQKDYQNITIYGYKKQFNLGQGGEGIILAGLEGEVVTKDKHGRAMVTPKLDEKGIKEQYYAFKHCVCYGLKAKEEKREETSLELEEKMRNLTIELKIPEVQEDKKPAWKDPKRLEVVKTPPSSPVRQTTQGSQLPSPVKPMTFSKESSQVTRQPSLKPEYGRDRGEKTQQASPFKPRRSTRIRQGKKEDSSSNPKPPSKLGRDRGMGRGKNT